MCKRVEVIACIYRAMPRTASPECALARIAGPVLSVREVGVICVENKHVTSDKYVLLRVCCADRATLEGIHVLWFGCGRCSFSAERG